MLRKALCLALVACFGTVAHAQLAARLFVSGLDRPVAMTQDPVRSYVQYVVEQGGKIKVILKGLVQRTDFLDLSNKITLPPPNESLGERGLLGLEFSPDYATSGIFYVYYTDRTLPGNVQVSRFRRMADNPLRADPTSEVSVINVAQPFANHKGGTARFGPDGMLYIGFGDGGSANDPGNRAQDPNLLLGKMIRIDPSRDDFPADPVANYGIPPDNPFLDGIPIPARQEIWAFGYRNPFKFSFDNPLLGGTGAMIVADVGQATWEELDYEPAGAGGRNYGWRQREGAHDTGLGGASYMPLTDPILDYDHTVGRSITGGYVYRGKALRRTYVGRYFYADFILKKVWSLGLTIDQGTGEATVSNITEHTAELGGPSVLGNISSIDVNVKGELFVVSYSRGMIFQIVSAP